MVQKNITEEGLKNSTAWIVPKGSIYLAMYASVGKDGILVQDAATSQDIFNMVFFSNIIRNFVYTLLDKAEIFSECE